MTPKQTARYWVEWGFVRGYCKAHRLPEPDRYALHAQALANCTKGTGGGRCDMCQARLVKGGQISSLEFHFPPAARDHFVDLLFGAFRAVHQPANLNGQIRQLQQPRKRAEFPFPELLKLIGLYVGDPEAYVAEICHDKFGTPHWQDLDHAPAPEKANPKWHSSQLDKLRYTLNRCLNGKGGLRNQAGDSIHDMRTKAGLECGCSECARRRFATPAPAMAMAGDDNEPF